MHTNKEQPLNQRQPQSEAAQDNTQPSSPQRAHTDAGETRQEDNNIHKTKEDIRQVPQAPDVQSEEDIIEHTSWERPQTEEDEDRVL